MKLFMFLSSLAVIRGCTIQDLIVDTNGVKYQREILYNNLYVPSKLVVDYTTNNVFFNGASRIAKFNLNTKELEYFKREFFECLGIDQDTHDVYIGSGNDIYKYSEGIHEAELAQVIQGPAGISVWRIYFKTVLYYNTYDTGDIYMLVNGTSNMFVTLDEMVKFLLIDNEDNLYYSTDNQKLYSQKKGTKDILYDGNARVTALATDKNGKIYFCSDDGIYEVIKDSATVRKIVSTVCYYGLAFDSDNNIVYSDHYRIMRLKPIEEIEKNISENITNTTDTTICDNVSDNTLLTSLNEKIDKLMQKIDNLQRGDRGDERAQVVSSSQTIHLDTMKNINITLSITGEGGVGGV